MSRLRDPESSRQTLMGWSYNEKNRRHMDTKNFGRDSTRSNALEGGHTLDGRRVRYMDGPAEFSAGSE
ncbi:unnamed protein product [Strongylus vulgaris]|uniref:Uncharacterized protein n=1 Tax=Strongylus vulgaris TaxID=40348 RepID=A0A3P7K7Z7_STRVU|nr:unnamed protein product [Strongylus vulgaris]